MSLRLLPPVAIALIERRLTSKTQTNRASGPLPESTHRRGNFVGLSAIIFFYSGNLRNWNGLEGLYQAFLPWTKTGIDAAGHGKPDFDLFPLTPAVPGNSSRSRSIRESQAELVLGSFAA